MFLHSCESRLECLSLINITLLEIDDVSGRRPVSSHKFAANEIRKNDGSTVKVSLQEFFEFGRLQKKFFVTMGNSLKNPLRLDIAGERHRIFDIGLVGKRGVYVCTFAHV